MRKLLLAFCFLLGANLRAENARTLSLGEQASLSVEPGTRFSVGNGEVIQVKATQLPGGRSLLLVKGKSQGYSDLILLADSGERTSLAFRVVSKRQGALAKDGQSLLAVPEGVKLQPSGDGWVARGQARDLDDWNVVKAMEDQGKGRLQNLLRLHPLERLRAESRIRALLKAGGVEGIGVRSAGNTLLLTGDARSQAEKELAEELGRQVVKGVRSEIRVPFERGGRLRFRAKILELLKGSGGALGLQWQEGVPSALQVGTGTLKANLALEAALRLMEKKGQARLLSQPELLLNEKEWRS